MGNIKVSSSRLYQGRIRVPMRGPPDGRWPLPVPPGARMIRPFAWRTPEARAARRSSA